jgi:hypothetical protein
MLRNRQAVTLVACMTKRKWYTQLKYKWSVFSLTTRDAGARRFFGRSETG